MSLPFRKVVQGLAEIHPVANLERKGKGVFLNLGEASYPPSSRVVTAMISLGGKIDHYPDNVREELSQKIALYCDHSFDANWIHVGNGSDAIIELLAKALLDDGDEAIAPAPTFFVYGHATSLMGGRLAAGGRTVGNHQSSLDVDAILQSLKPLTKLIFIANPNNPTGDLTSREDIEKLLHGAKSSVVVVDECYFEISGETVADLLPKYPNLVILRSFSKSFALAGLRVGYAVAHPEMIMALRKVDQYFSVNRPALVAASAALDDLGYYQRNIEELKKRRQSLAGALSHLSMLVYPSNANFLLVDYSPLFKENIVPLLEKEGVYVADFHGKQGLQFAFRTSVGTDADNRALITALNALISSRR